LAVEDMLMLLILECRIYIKYIKSWKMQKCRSAELNPERGMCVTQVSVWVK
jgi:hypothetical protein